MGAKIGEIIRAGSRPTSLEALTGRVVAVDAQNTLYQFLSTIRQPDGTPLTDSAGRTTSHLSGLIYRTTHLVAKGLKLVFVFDGKPSELKAEVLKARAERRAEALRKWEEAKVLFPEEPEKSFKYAQASAKVDAAVVEDAKRLLTYLGVPCVQAAGEGEAQAAFLVQRGDAELVSSQDYDSLLFGAPVVVRNLTAAGAPRRKAALEVVELRAVEERLGLTREQLVDLAILVGTDFNPGVKGVGVKRALKLVKTQKQQTQKQTQKQQHHEQHHALEELVENYELVRKIFLQPEVSETYELNWGAVEAERVKEFLCEEHDFSVERVSKVLEKISQTARQTRQKRIEQWF